MLYKLVYKSYSRYFYLSVSFLALIENLHTNSYKEAAVILLLRITSSHSLEMLLLTLLWKCYCLDLWWKCYCWHSCLKKKCALPFCTHANESLLCTLVWKRYGTYSFGKWLRTLLQRPIFKSLQTWVLPYTLWWRICHTHSFGDVCVILLPRICSSHFYGNVTVHSSVYFAHSLTSGYSPM